MARSRLKSLIVLLGCLAVLAGAATIAWLSLTADGGGHPASGPLFGAFVRDAGPARRVPGQVAPTWDLAGSVRSIRRDPATPGRVVLQLDDGRSVDGQVVDAGNGSVAVRLGPQAGGPAMCSICQLGEGGPVAIISGDQRFIFRDVDQTEASR